MIDVIINEVGGMTVAHDEKELDAFDSVEVAVVDGSLALSGAGGRRELGRLKPSMLEMVREGMQARSVRMSGWSLAKITPLMVTISR
jgi:hypothetical protein